MQSRQIRHLVFVRFPTIFTMQNKKQCAKKTSWVLRLKGKYITYKILCICIPFCVTSHPTHTNTTLVQRNCHVLPSLNYFLGHVSNDDKYTNSRDAKFIGRSIGVMWEEVIYADKCHICINNVIVDLIYDHAWSSLRSILKCIERFGSKFCLKHTEKIFQKKLFCNSRQKSLNLNSSFIRSWSGEISQ